MSIQRIQRQKGYVYRVKWRDEGRRMRSRNFDRKKDADTFEAKVKVLKRQGDLGDLDAGKETLRAFSEEWWKLYATPRLAPSTLRAYASLRDKHVLAALGNTPIRSQTAEKRT